MKVSNLKVSLLQTTPFLKDDGTFNLDRAMSYLGKIGGICYNENGLRASFMEDEEITQKRINRMTSGEHQSVFEHANISMYLENSPKFLNMILNNEHQFATSERSLRYTSIKDDGKLPSELVEMYNKWNKIFFDKIKKEYGDCKSDGAIMKLAQENSRYLMPVTIDTEMAHTIPLAQLNRLVVYLMNYKENGVNGKKDELHEEMIPHIDKFIEELRRVNVIDDRLLSNRKHRELSIFGQELNKTPYEFSSVYSTRYYGSLAAYAQAHRHRTIYYQLERLDDKRYYIPPIINDDPLTMIEWQDDMKKVANMGLVPQGEMVLISEKGTLDTFILKMKERLCSAAQLEVAMQTQSTRNLYHGSLSINSEVNELKKLEPYMKGARCTFPDYDCPHDCKFKEGKVLERKI